MAHTLEPAASGRSKCRGCARPIAKGELRLGERLPNPFADEGDMTLWFHPECGAYKRPEPLLEAIEAFEGALLDAERAERLGREARRSLEHRRLPRIDGVERASTGRAACRCCREKIAKDGWRIRLVFYEEGRFSPGGFIHAGCAEPYFETTDVLARLRCFTPDLGAEDLKSLEDALAGA